MAAPRSILLIGNPENRRSTLFADAAGEAGVAVAIRSWRDVLDGVSIDATGSITPDHVRMDAMAENQAVFDLLWRRRMADEPNAGQDHDGRSRTRPEPTEVGEPVNLAEVLTATAEDLAGRFGIERLLADPTDLAVLFDKGRAHARLRAAGVPVPDALITEPRNWSDLRDAMNDRRWSRVFVKPVAGSSASGVLAVSATDARVELTSTVVVRRGTHGPRFHNGLGLNRYRDADAVEIIDHVLGLGCHVERWFPKLAVDGRVTDVRVLVVAGEPRHGVARGGPGPITNLHAGNQRIELEHLRARIEPGCWEAAMAACATAATRFRSCLHLGVDLMFSSRGNRFAVAEVNAFGDLLPGVTSRGRSTYEAEIDALLDGTFDRWRRSTPVVAA